MSKPMYNLGDVLDKLTILSMKIYFGDEASIAEHRYLERSLAYFGLNGKIITNVIRLTLMNRFIWELENELRKGLFDSDEHLKEHGRRAIKIRDFNRKRIEYKNIINTVAKSFKETKVQHRSGDSA